MEVGVYVVLNKKVEVVELKELVVDAKSAKQLDDQSYCEFGNSLVFVLYLSCLGK